MSLRANSAASLSSSRRPSQNAEGPGSPPTPVGCLRAIPAFEANWCVLVVDAEGAQSPMLVSMSVWGPGGPAGEESSADSTCL